MKRLNEFAGMLVFLGLVLPLTVRALWVVYPYNANNDWIAYDFIGWVRVEEVVEVPTPSLERARVRMKVIERLKGDDIPSLQLVYQDQYVIPGKEDQVVTIGTEQRWREYVGQEFFVFLQKQPDGTYLTEHGRYFRIMNGWILGLPREYQDYFLVPGNPNAGEFFAQAKAKASRAGEGASVPPFQNKLRPKENPKATVERFLRSLLEGRSRDAEQLLCRTNGYGTPDYIVTGGSNRWTSLKGFTVVREVRRRNSAIVVVTADDDRSAVEPIYLVRKDELWWLLNPWPSMGRDDDEVKKLKSGKEFAELEKKLGKDTLRR